MEPNKTQQKSLVSSNTYSLLSFYISPLSKNKPVRASFAIEGSTTVQLADTGVSCVEEVASTPQESDPLDCEVRQAVLSIAEAGPVTLLQIA